MSKRLTGSPTLADIARELGVTTASVSLALNDRPGVSDKLRREVGEVAERLGYRPNRAAVALRTSRTHVLGLLSRNLRNPAFLDVVEGFDRECGRLGYEVMVGSAHFDLDRERSLISTFAGRQVDGLAASPINGTTLAREWLRRTQRPLVLISTASRSRQAMSVGAGGEPASRAVLDHLVQLGHRRIAVLAAPSATSPDPERVSFFVEEAKRLRLSCRVVESELDLEPARAQLAVELSRSAARRPTVVITNSDYLAHAVYLAARDCGLTIPGDVSVVGHDDISTSELLDPPLTTLAVDRWEMGTIAARLLVDAVEGRRPARRNVELPAQLRVRASTAPPP